MSYPLEMEEGLEPLSFNAIKKDEKKENMTVGRKDFKYPDPHLEENMKFLEYIGSGASDVQVLQALYEVLPEQLRAIRILVSHVMKANKNFASDYVRNDVEQNQGRRAYKYVRRGKRMVRVLIRHPAPPKTNTKMKPASLKRVATLKKFLHDLLNQKANRPQLRAKSRFVKEVVRAGLELYHQKKSTTNNTTQSKPDQNGSSSTNRKEKSKEKNRKRKAEGLRDGNDDDSPKEAQGWSSAIPDKDVEQDAWFHNTYSSESAKNKKARSQSSAKNFANAKRSKKAQRESSEESEASSEADSEESSESDARSSDGYSSE